MTIESRYQNSLTDVLTLLQQAVFRYITDLQVDLTKFFQFFKQFHRNMVSLQDNFHPNKLKFSKYLTKLHHLTQQVEYNTKERMISLEPSEKSGFQRTGSTREKSKELKKTQGGVSKHSIMQPARTDELNVIGEIEEREDFDDVRFKVNKQVDEEEEEQFNHEEGIDVNQNTLKGNFYEKNRKKRVGTAQGSRHKMSVTIDFHNTRPYTGSYARQQKVGKSSQKLFINSNGFQPSTRERYKSLTKYEKVPSSTDPNFQPSSISHIQHPYSTLDHPQPPTINQPRIFNINQRKSIYDVLQEEKKSRNDVQTDEEFLKSGLVKLPEKKKQGRGSKTWSRWSFKINKLL